MGGQDDTGATAQDGIGTAAQGGTGQLQGGTGQSGAGNAIEVRALRKSFGRTVALDGLDLTVRTGEVHAFLGPNGAGKTTTIRILLGLLAKDGGEAVLLGGDPWRDAV